MVWQVFPDASDQTVVSDFGKHSGDIESMSRNSGIKENVRNQVDSMVEDNTDK